MCKAWTAALAPDADPEWGLTPGQASDRWHRPPGPLVYGSERGWVQNKMCCLRDGTQMEPAQMDIGVALKRKPVPLGQSEVMPSCVLRDGVGES